MLGKLSSALLGFILAKNISEDKLSDSLVKIDRASAYVYPIAAISRSTISDRLEEIAFELKKQMDMLLSVVRKHGVENEFAKKLHCRFSF